MAIVNQQLEDDNSHGAGGSTSSVHEIARVNASDEAQMERMIRLYLENMCPMIRVNSEDDNSHGAGGSTSSVADLARFSTFTEAEMERVTICKETLWPMICEINAKQQNFLSVIKEKFGLDLTRNSGNRASTSGSPIFQFLFLNGISTPVSTGLNIEGRDHKPFVIALVDQNSGKIVNTGAEAATEVEIVVLEGDCNDFDTENWTSDEFNNKIVGEWKGKKVLQGNTFVKLKEGIVYVNKISFTHNSAWKGNRFCRLGARSVDAIFATTVKEAKTEIFSVMDKRKLLYNKHTTPTLSDHVYRLHKINKRSACYNRLKEASIKTVMDLRTFNAINPGRLKDIIKVHPNTWKIIMDHVQMCKDDKGIYLYHHPRDGQKRDGVVFNVSGQLVGLVADSKFLPTDKLPSNKTADAEKLVVSATQHWGEVVPFIDEASLFNHLQSPTTLNSFPNTLNLVFSHTPSENDWKHDIVGVVTTPTSQSSQSPKRPASEHSLSNSPKKPRDNHQQTSLCMPTNRILSNTHVTCNNLEHTELLTTSEVSEGDDWMKYLDFSELDIVPAQRWKRVWYVVGWISIFSKIRNRKITSDPQSSMCGFKETGLVESLSVF